MGFLVIVLFALAISIDSFVIGLAYGIKNIRLSLQTLAIVTFCSAGLLLLFMVAGEGLATYLSPLAVNWLAAGLLGALGIGKLYSAYREERPRAVENARTLLLYWRLPLVPYAIQILYEPERALCEDGTQVKKESAWALGLAMSFDAVGGGFAASLAGLPLVWTVLMAALVTGTLLVAALLIGRRFRVALLANGQQHRLERLFNYLPGAIMILLALWKIL